MNDLIFFIGGISKQNDVISDRIIEEQAIWIFHNNTLLFTFLIVGSEIVNNVVHRNDVAVLTTHDDTFTKLSIEL